MSSKPVLAYWDIRARAQPIRLLLAYIGVDFEDRRYKFIDRDDYLADKFSLGLDFPNLPYYIDGDLKLTQSLAIIRYLAAKHGLMAGTDDPPRLAMQSMVEQYLDDIKQGFVPILLSDDYAAKRSEYSAGPLTTQLDQLVKFMGDEPWLTGDQLSYVDFMGYELLDWIRLFTPETLANYPTIGHFLDRFEALPDIKLYMQSEGFTRSPLFGPAFKWGFKPLE